MTRLLPACVGALCIGACATTDVPDASSTDSVPAVPAVPTQSATVDASKQAENSTQTVAKSGIEMIEVPAVVPTEIAVTASRDDGRICRRERRTGTHRVVKVCRSRAEVRRIEQESKDTFRALHESQMLQEKAERMRRP